MLRFGRRGRENLSTLTGNDFAVSNNGNGTLYVYEATDEKTKKQKKHQDIQIIIKPPMEECMKLKVNIQVIFQLKFSIDFNSILCS